MLEDYKGVDLQLRKQRLFWIFLFVFLTMFAILASIVMGTVEVSFYDIITMLKGESQNYLAERIICNIRLPRTLLGLLVGINMGAAGALLQGGLRNPMASPKVIGVNSGAGLAAVIIMTLFPGKMALIPLAAFLGALLSSLIIYGLSFRQGSSSNTKIILAGIALGAMFSAFTSALMTLHSDELGVTYSWLIGGLTGRGWTYFNMIWPYTILGMVGALLLSPSINLFLLGEEVGQNLGLSVEITRALIIITSSVLAGSAVSVAGTIGFLGIIAPHAARMLIGEDYRYLIVFSPILGGVLLVLADVIARTLFQPMEISVGIITAALGAPFFFLILYKKKK